VKPAFLFGFCIAAIPIPVLAADRTEQVAGWTLSDRGSKPGNDLDREVAMLRKAQGVEIAYKPGPGRSGAISVKFSGCEGSSEYSASLQFKSSAEAIKSVRDEISYDFAEFRKGCAAVTAETEKSTMDGFDKAFDTVTQWVNDKPFVYPPNTPAAPAAEGGKMAPEDMT
jgi:hypothetical protein